MEKFIEFVLDNKSLIIALITVFLTVLTNLLGAIVLKRTKNESVKEFILEKLPSYISSAESIFKDHIGDVGKEKKDFVIASINEALTQNFKKVNSSIYRGFIVSSLEKILSTPQKKEAKK